MKYQPDQSIVDYNDWDLATSSVITGDFTTDSLKYGFGPTSLRAESDTRYGVAFLEHDPASSSNPKVSGTIHLEETGDGLKIDYEIRGLYDGLHGFHIHEYGDLTDGCTSACAHFNPDNTTHGGLTSDVRHMGDLGNISSKNRVSKGSLFLPKAKLDGSKYGVLGRMMIVHADEDDLGQGGNEESLKTGNAGKRLACGVIGLAEPPSKTFNSEAFDWLPAGNWVDLGYDNAPTAEELKSQIEAGDHDDSYGNLGCPNCGNVDLFWKKTTSKGKTFRCLSCEWSDNYETVKSQGDITLQKFGLTVDCPLCGETISAYNRASIDSHFRKHKKEAAEASEPKVSEAENEWQEEIEWNEKSKKKTEPEWEDVEWESETRRCCECHTTEGLTTIQAGTFCYDCLPINLGAEVHLLPDAPRAGWYDRHDDSVNINLANKGIRNEALEDNYSGLFDTIAHEYGHQVTSHETRSPYHSEFAAFMVQTNGDFARSKLLAVIHPMCFREIIMKLPSDSDGMISDETLDNFFSTLDFENNLDIIVQAKRFVTYSTIPEWHKDWLKHLISYVETGTSANVIFEAEDDYWAGSVAKAIVNEMGDDYYDEDLHEYNCVHFAQEMSEYLAQDGIPHEIQSIAGYGGEVAHAWVYVPSEKEYYDAWTPYGVSDWKDLGFWETLDYTPEWLEQQTPESFEAEDNYDSTYGKAQAKIRRKLKNKIKKQAIMGTKAGQWSARKSQELKRQYEAACSKKGLKPYKGQKTKSQDNLSKWSKQGWKTASGKKSSVTGEPYFPAKAVTALKQKNLYAKAKRQKQAATKAGKQNARYSDDIRAVVKQYRAEDTECEVCRVPLSPEEKSLCNTCWESYEQSLKPQKEWWAESKRFSAPYQPNQTLLDYSPYEMATSSAITGDFFTDSLKYGFGPESKSSENVR